MTNNTQLPADVQGKIHSDTNMLYDQLDSAAREIDSYDFGLPQFDRQTEPIRNILTEYATKLHQEQQENAELRQWKKEQLLVWGPLHEYGLSCDELKIGESISAFILNRCKRFEQAQKVFEKVIDLYDLTPEDELYNEIKTFLDGK